MTTKSTIGSWVRLLPIITKRIDAETQYGPTQGIGLVIKDNYGQLYIRWNTLPLGSNASHSRRNLDEIHLLTERECHQHQNWIEGIDVDEIRHTFGDITIPESRVDATGEPDEYPYYAQLSEIELIEGRHYLHSHEYGLYSFEDVLVYWDERRKDPTHTGIEIYRADDSSIWSRPAVAP